MDEVLVPKAVSGPPSPQPWLRSRFHSDADDWRTVTWPPPGPYWCTGYGEDYSVIVAYHRANQDVVEWWPEASNIDTEEAPEGPEFSSRFPRPEWWTDEGVVT